MAKAIFFFTVLLLGSRCFAQTFTVDYASHYTSTLVNPTTVAATNLGVFTYYGFPVANYNVANGVESVTGINSNALSSFPPIQVSFDLIGTNCELIVNEQDFSIRTNTTVLYGYFTISDGTTTTSYTNELVGISHPTWYIPVTFTNGGPHHIYFSIKGNFAGVNVTAGNTVAQDVLSPKPNLLLVLGDSYTEGFNPNQYVYMSGKYPYPSYWFDGWVWQLAHLVQNTIPMPSGIGGTGFLKTNGPSPNYLDRVVSDVCAAYTNLANSGLYNQIFIAASGTINDDGLDTNICYSNATNVYTLIKNACPGAKIFAVGNWLGAGGRTAPTTTDRALEWAMTNAAATVGIPIFDPIPANLKNASNYLVFYPTNGTDSVHPSAAGYAIMANWVNSQLTALYGTNWDPNAGISQSFGNLPGHYTLTVNNGRGSGIYTNGQVVTITAGINPGLSFVNWSGLDIADTNSNVTTITMPASDLTVTANLTNSPVTTYYLLAVNNGTGTGVYTNGQLVTISAVTGPGTAFTSWSGPGIADTNSATTTLYMPASNLVVTANYTVVATGTAMTLNVADFGAVGDVVQFSVNTVSNSTVVSVAGTNMFSSADIGKVIEVFRAGPWVTYSNWGPVVTQQDIICTIQDVEQETNLTLSIPCGWTTNAYCVVGRNNAQAFQAAINAASNDVAQALATNVTITIPPGKYLMVSSNVLNANYVMQSASDTHPAITVSSGGISFVGTGDSPTDTVLMGCGAGMEHLVAPGTPISWISPSYAPYLPMRDTLVFCKGPVKNSQYPLTFQNLTFDGGLTNGVQNYNYWTLIQGSGEGWDTTHHAVADFGAFGYGAGYMANGQGQMNQLKVFTNCVFQHWRGEILICWTADITNAFNDIANCTFRDSNATADNMYYGQHVHGCTFDGVGKVMEYYQGNASLPTVFENNMWTNIAAGNHYALTIVGATTNATPPSFTIKNNVFHDETGISAIQFSPAANVSVIGNAFYGNVWGVTFTSAGVQPSDGSAIPVMTNFVIACNTNFILSMDGYPVSDMLISNNVGIRVFASAGYKKRIVLADNVGTLWDGHYDVSGAGISLGQNMVDLTNNNWCMPNTSPDGGAYAVTNYMTYGNGRLHKINNGSGVFYLDDSNPSLIPPQAMLTVMCSTLNGADATNVYTSRTSPVAPMTITNNTSMTFYWNGSAWVTTLSIAKLAPPDRLRIGTP